jgi:hypothetical protein
MATVLSIFKFASSSIENARAWGKGSEDLLEPSLAINFIDVFVDKHDDFLLAIKFCKNEQAELIAVQAKVSM